MITSGQLASAHEESDAAAVLLLHSTGQTEIVTGCDDITPYQVRDADPRYVCRIGAVHSLVRALGAERARDQINRLLPEPNPQTKEA
ncbi:hypothetical protein [Rhodococcus sp. USK13]|uniref:hypothetical protein n=1 Tax=Rhodococcus sp. USK13 TaxID=2806442 RepID=UPI001BCED127|nr:hypothetical protein [Rhodococcus sp. USK13]